MALDLDPQAAARDYRERMVGPYRGILPAAAITSMEEQLSGSCTVESPPSMSSPNCSVSARD